MECDREVESSIEGGPVEMTKFGRHLKKTKAPTQLTISQHLIRFGNFAKLSVGLVQVVGILVRMPLERQLFVSKRLVKAEMVAGLLVSCLRLAAQLAFVLRFLNFSF